MQKSNTIAWNIKKIIVDALNKTFNKNKKTSLPLDFDKIFVDKVKNIELGDFTSNVLFVVDYFKDKQANSVNEFINNIDKNIFDKIEVAKNGFINFYLNNQTKSNLLNEICDKKDKYGFFDKKNISFNIEFVSANPTGLLHIGHARNAAYGDSLARILTANGIKVDREYYINDGGNQINKLALSVLIRYLQQFNVDVQLPDDSYHANEIIEIAKLLKEKNKDKYLHTKFDINTQILDKDANQEISLFAINYLLDEIKSDLAKLDVYMDIWSPESDIYKNNLVQQALTRIQKYLYDKDGAKWLKTTSFGDDKDRVLIKSDGTYTYFTPDIAYHNLKLSRGYEKIINIWGADHKSYVERMSIAIQMLGYKKTQMYVCIMQMISLTKNGEAFKMSKRSGDSFTTRDLVNFIGKDAARWYLVSQSLSTHINIDIEKTTKHNDENGLFYVQYAYVRIKQILKKNNLSLINKCDELTQPLEKEIINQLFFFMPTIQNIMKSYEVHKMCLYLTNLAKHIHAYYEKVKIIDDNNKTLSGQRLFLITAASYVIKNGLKLIGCDVKEQM